MILEKNHIYHIFNRGNNKRSIFYKEENYCYFVEKIRKFILPYTAIYAYCLMPNHFHMMIEITHETINGLSINDSIGRMLSSYARAINKQQATTGSLFQQHSKARCLTEQNELSPNYYNTSKGTLINISNKEREYPSVCMAYIHYNPVVDGLVSRPQDWKFSSYREYSGKGVSGLININQGNYYFVP